MGVKQSPPKPDMASPQTAAIITLPDELKQEILLYSSVRDALRLRATCRAFYAFIRQPKHAEWLLIEREDWCVVSNLLACGGCSRLRKAEKFSLEMRSAPPEMEWVTKVSVGGRSFTLEPAMWTFGGNPMGRGGKRAGERFCNDCGRRDLEDEEVEKPMFRYGMGRIWDEEGVNYVRCVNCERIDQAPKRGDLGVCRRCYEVMVREADEMAEGSRKVGWERK